MKNPQYSILYFKENFTQHLEEIGTFLQEGKKVFWFGSQEEVEQLKKMYKPFASAFFLQAFTITEAEGVENFGPASIIDGAGIRQEWSQLFCWLEEKIPVFNAAQYRVEHAGGRFQYCGKGVGRNRKDYCYGGPYFISDAYGSGPEYVGDLHDHLYE